MAEGWPEVSEKVIVKIKAWTSFSVCIGYVSMVSVKLNADYF